MASYRIRHYQDQDFEAVRSLFTRGMLEHSPAGYRHVLRSPRVQLQLLALFILVRAAGGSWLLALVLGLVIPATAAASLVQLQHPWHSCSIPGTTNSIPGTAAASLVLLQHPWHCCSIPGTAAASLALLQHPWYCCSIPGTAAASLAPLQHPWHSCSIPGTAAASLAQLQHPWH
uniref:Uncharacterized protein n=1 Tax=Melopsittacus undulatus TaxID=13146 RepID=A0A8V5GHD4_MELUD